MTWLAGRLAPVVGDDVRIAQLRYRDSSWNLLEGSIDDVAEAIAHEHAGRRQVLLVALSMGGATSAANVAQAGVAGLVVMAPWFPDAIPVEPLARVPLRVVHGQLDNALPFVPGTSLERSRAVVDRVDSLGGDARWRRIPLGLHGLAVRAAGRTWVLPRARACARVIVQDVRELLGSEPQ